jgi:hypothetical protein
VQPSQIDGSDWLAEVLLLLPACAQQPLLLKEACGMLSSRLQALGAVHSAAALLQLSLGEQNMKDPIAPKCASNCMMAEVPTGKQTNHGAAPVHVQPAVPSLQWQHCLSVEHNAAVKTVHSPYRQPTHPREVCLPASLQLTHGSCHYCAPAAVRRALNCTAAAANSVLQVGTCTAVILQQLSSSTIKRSG